jgi:hypothetical protein
MVKSRKLIYEILFTYTLKGQSHKKVGEKDPGK